MMETNNEPTQRTPSYQNGVEEEGDYSRRDSASSSTTSPNYDSGNVSDLNYLRPASLSSAEDDSISNEYAQHDKFQHLLREKDQSLFLALQDVRKLKSELERLSKSEKWYKSELRSQKNSRMEILEKLYTNERRFTQENQRLQNECVSLYARCSEIENRLQAEKDMAIKLVQSNSKVEAAVMDGGGLSRDFELAQHRQKLADQEELIDMLRNQKRCLFRDLQKLSCEKDEIVLELQKNIAQVEDENRTITKRCLQLTEVRNLLKGELEAKGAECSSMSAEVLDLRIIVKSLEEKLHSHITDLNQKENEVDRLKHELSQKQHSDKITEFLQRKHQRELSEKLESICSLNDTITSLKAEINSLEVFRNRHDDQKSEIAQLQYLLQERTSEAEALRKVHDRIANEKDLQSSTEQYQKTSDTSSSLKEENHILYQQNLTLQRELNSMKSEYEITSQSLSVDNLRKTKQELEQLSEKYLGVCKLYEKSKFDSDMKDISVEKFKFEKEKDSHEIGILREKLVEVSKKFECQKSLVTEFELALSRTKQEKCRLDSENKCNIATNLELKLEVSQSIVKSNEKDVEISNLRTQLSKVEDMLNKHNTKLNSADVAALLFEKDSSESRVASIQRQLELQSEKVRQMNAEQNEWENLLKVINGEEKLMELGAMSGEFESLNQLFEDQNLELMQINENQRRQYFSLKEDLKKTEIERKTFQQEFETAKIQIISLEKQVEALESANVDYQKEIAHLAGTNERLIQEFSEDFSRERENHKKQEKQLKLEVKLRTTESDKLRKEIDVLHSEVDRLRTSDIKFSEKVIATCDSDLKSDESVKSVVPHRLLQNVIETEHRRKMSRYDIHIRSLLSNIKSYKKKLETAESRYDTLLTKSKEMVEVEELRAMETDLQNMRMQFECSQKEINNLKHQLKTVRDEFCVTDANKNSNTMDLTNLMDDYKKLIQQSQTAAKRPSTSEIYKLINKSNNFVPKLTNISTSVDGLREDIQQMCTALNLSSPAGRGSPQPKLSLMDELKIAENGKLC